MDSTQTPFPLANSYVTNAYQILQIRPILLLHIFHHGYAIVMKKIYKWMNE